jgi:uncharacterized DUF497 family protein
VDISFDPAKNERNIATHGISLERAIEFDWNGALHREDTRRDYGERRYRAYGVIGARVHVLVYTPREGMMHVISLRKANKREVRRYEGQEEEQGETHVGSD